MARSALPFACDSPTGDSSVTISVRYVSAVRMALIAFFRSLTLGSWSDFNVILP